MINADAISALITAIAVHPSVVKQQLNFPAPADAHFRRVNPGILVWEWGGPSKGKRGKASLAYYDLDGQIVTVGLLALGDDLIEIELLRGDGTPVLSIPRSNDLWDFLPGRVYSPRS